MSEFVCERVCEFRCESWTIHQFADIDGNGQDCPGLELMVAVPRGRVPCSICQAS